ncbi:hypothetical protein CB1_000728001 [Camelus ferus]|nr:hypothetical protein CB1_000728001 [Camelus ferus]
MSTLRKARVIGPKWREDSVSGERTGQKCPSVQSDAKQHGCSLGICPGPVQQYRVLCSHLAGMRPSEPVVHTLILLSHPGPDVHGILQGATVLTACWRIFAFLVFIWRTVLAGWLWIQAEKGQDSKWDEEKRLPIRTNQDLLEEIDRLAMNEDQLKKEMQDTKGQNELFGVPLLEPEIALAEKKAQDNWLRAQALERENAEMRREVAYLKQRLEAISRQRQAEEYMRQEAILGGPYGLHPPLTCKEHTVKCSSFISAAKAAQWAPCPRG